MDKNRAKQEDLGGAARRQGLRHWLPVLDRSDLIVVQSNVLPEVRLQVRIGLTDCRKRNKQYGGGRYAAKHANFALDTFRPWAAMSTHASFASIFHLNTLLPIPGCDSPDG
jgi:hypothetical protein